MNKEKDEKKKKKLLIVIILFLILLLVGGLFFYIHHDKGNQIDKNAKNYDEQITPPNGFDKNHILIPGFKNINVTEGYDKAGMELMNPKQNNVYFKYEVYLKKNGKLIASTDLVPPGKAVEIFPWKGLKVGTYKLNVKISTYAINDNKKQLNGANVEVVMNIIN